MKIARIIVTPAFQKDSSRWHQYTLDQCHSLVSIDWFVRLMNKHENLYDVMVEHIPKQRQSSSEAYDSTTAHHNRWGGDKAGRAKCIPTITNIVILSLAPDGHALNIIVNAYIAEHYPAIVGDINNFHWMTRLPLQPAIRHDVPTT